MWRKSESERDCVIKREEMGFHRVWGPAATAEQGCDREPEERRRQLVSPAPPPPALVEAGDCS